MLTPSRGEFILDAGCGTGVFTTHILETGARVVGLELSRPMLVRAIFKYKGRPFLSVQGDMRRLPFADDSFDKAGIRICRYNPVQKGSDGKSVYVHCWGRGRPNGHCR